jgi:DNA-directed RNA polymerase specialized sigma24 family protein
MLKLPRLAPSHEDLFIERYARLLRWGADLQGADGAAAEDLVHDAFLAFTLGQPDLDRIRDLDAYLYATLRNLHLSNVRRASHRFHAPIEVIDYDTAAIMLRNVNPI